MVQAKAVAQVETEEFTRVLQGFLGVKSARHPRPVKTGKEQREKRGYVMVLACP